MAVVPDVSGRAGEAEAGEVAGVARAMREAGAAVEPARLGDDAVLAGGRIRRSDAAYLLVVRVTDSAVYHAYSPGRYDGAAGRPTATRTTGRRVGMRLVLRRADDGTTLWAARGSADVWCKRVEPVPAATVAATVEEDLRAGNGHFYPVPPDAAQLTARLMRRMVARVPVETPLEPN